MTECSWATSIVATPWRCFTLGARRRQGAPARRCGRSVAVFYTPLHRPRHGREAGAHVGGAKTCCRCRTAKEGAGGRPLAIFAATVRNSAVPA